MLVGTESVATSIGTNLVISTLILNTQTLLPSYFTSRNVYCTYLYRNTQSCMYNKDVHCLIYNSEKLDIVYVSFRKSPVNDGTALCEDTRCRHWRECMLYAPEGREVQVAQALFFGGSCSVGPDPTCGKRKDVPSMIRAHIYTENFWEGAKETLNSWLVPLGIRFDEGAKEWRGDLLFSYMVLNYLTFCHKHYFYLKINLEEQVIKQINIFPAPFHGP